MKDSFERAFLPIGAGIGFLVSNGIIVIDKCIKKYESFSEFYLSVIQPNLPTTYDLEKFEKMCEYIGKSFF